MQNLRKIAVAALTAGSLMAGTILAGLPSAQAATP